MPFGWENGDGLAAEWMLLALAPEHFVIEPWLLRRRERQTRADEKQNLAAIRDDDAGERRAVQSAQRHRRVGPNGLDDVLEHATGTRRELRPDPVDEGDERVADERAQALGQMTSLTTATTTPAMAAAAPLRVAS